MQELHTIMVYNYNYDYYVIKLSTLNFRLVTFPCTSMCRKEVVIDEVSWASGNLEGNITFLYTCRKAVVKVEVAWTARKMEVGITFPCISMCRKA